MTTQARPRGKPATSIQPKKLLHSKWTAVTPIARQRHFVVTQVLEPELPEGPILWVEIEAVLSKKTQRILWRDLQDATRWTQGWSR